MPRPRYLLYPASGFHHGNTAAAGRARKFAAGAVRTFTRAVYDAVTLTTEPESRGPGLVKYRADFETSATQRFESEWI